MKRPYVILGTMNVPGEPEHVADARRFLRKVLGESHPEGDVGELLLSELVSNSVRHALRGQTGTIGVVVLEVGDVVRVEVVDGGGDTTPCLCSRDEFGESGRGMKLVDVMAARWGFVRDPAIGARTWFELEGSAEQ